MRFGSTGVHHGDIPLSPVSRPHVTLFPSTICHIGETPDDRQLGTHGAARLPVAGCTASFRIRFQGGSGSRSPPRENISYAVAAEN
jgi:hypothetical protein